MTTTCQYCGGRVRRSQLNLDHVKPRAHGGLTTWDNVVASCHPCNHHKGGRSPEQAHMKLIRKPFKPESYPFAMQLTRPHFHDAWRPYLNVVDFSYWNVELEP